MRITCAALTLMTASMAVSAHEQCNVDLDYGIVVNDQHIRILERDRTVVQINGNDQLIIQGEVMDLDADSQAVLGEYARGIRHSVPEVVDIAVDGVELGLEAVTRIMESFNPGGNASEEFEQAIEGIRLRLKQRFARTDDAVYLAPQGLNEMDDFMTQELEQDIENAVASSVGSLLMAVGDAMANGDGNFEERMERFSQKMERLGTEMEYEMKGRAEDLEYKAEQFCEELKELDKVETELFEHVPEMQRYELIRFAH